MRRPLSLLIIFIAGSMFVSRNAQAADSESVFGFAAPLEHRIETSKDFNGKFTELENLKKQVKLRSRDVSTEDGINLDGFQVFLGYLDREKLKNRKCDEIENSILFNAAPQDEEHCLKDMPDYIPETMKVLKLFCPEIKSVKQKDC